MSVSRRKQDLSERKQEWTRNLARKEALCAQAEALVESLDWEQASAEIKRLQGEWKTIGPVRRTKSEAVWQRFRGACDAFFERYKNRNGLTRATQRAQREALCAELEALVPDDPESAAPADLVARVESLLGRWREAPPAERRAGEETGERFSSALARVVQRFPSSFEGSELDPKATLLRMEKLCAKVEALLPAELVSPESPDATTLSSRLRDALATTTLGGRGALEERWRVAAAEVDAARAAWNRLGPLPSEEARELAERFEKACRLIRRRRPPASGR